MKKNKSLWLAASISVGVVAMSLSIATFKSYSDSIRSEAGAYSLTLNSSNGIIGNNVTTTKDITTDNDNYQVAFSYTNCSSLNYGHAIINANGKIVNDDHIRSIDSLSATFTTSGELKFRISYNGTTWGDYTSMVSTQIYPLSSNPYYVEFSTDGTHSVNLTSAVFTYTCLENPNANESGEILGEEYYFQKVTASKTDWSGEYMVVYEKSATVGYAFKGDYANGEYESVTISDGVIDVVPTATVILTKSGSKYNLKSSGGKYSGQYMYGTNNDNRLNFKSSADNTITVSEKTSGQGYGLSWGNYPLRMNDGSNGYSATWAFKFYKSSSSLNSEQSFCKLYEKVYKPLDVVPVEPTNVTLSASELNLGVGKTSTLSATVLPANATNKDVVWSSNNTNVATVSNSGLVTAVSAGTAVINVKSQANPSLSANCTVTVSEQVLDDWTLLVYVCGADLESASRNGGCASQDIEEMRKTTGQPDGVNIVLETGGAKSWKSNIIGGSGVTKITAGELGRYHITNNKVIKDGALADANMGEASTLQNFIEWGIENYPAQKYGLFMWNHGGALSGCCFDENHDDDSLTADELTQAVTAARNNKNITNKFEFIAYDACLMAVQDVAEYNASNFNYMLSSQESEYSGGYVYNEWLPTLYDNPSSVSTVTLLSTIGSTFLDYFNSKGYYDQTQSVYDLSKMSAYKTAFESFASDLDAILGDDESKALTLVNTIYPAQKYGQDSDNGETIYPFDIFDVNSALAKITANSTFSSLSSKAQVVRTALSQLVVYEDHGSSITGCGICLYCPISLYSLPYDYNYNGYVGPTSNFTNWKEVANKAFWASYDDYVANNS